MKIYKVGGAVRDKILGKSSHDNDYVVVGATKDEMISLGFKPVGKAFPVFLHPKTKEEYALARKERKTGDKHTDFEFVFSPDITLKEDLERRDLTCNAIAYDEETKEYIDYFGGLDDIRNRTLKHINATHFVEDPLRVLRVCRLSAQLDFDAHPETIDLCKKMVADGAMTNLTVERIYDELKKALMSKKPSRFFILMHETGALKEVMPELDVLYDTPEHSLYHPEGTTFGHIMTALDLMPNASLLVKFGILTHDFGKALTPKDILPRHLGHENRAGGPIKVLCRRLKIQKKYCRFALAAAKYHMLYFKLFQMRCCKIYDLVDAFDIMHTSYIKDYIEVCRADMESCVMEDKEKARAIFDAKAEMLILARDTMKSTRATDMPGFAKTPKDRHFAKLFKAYKIDVLKKTLNKR